MRFGLFHVNKIQLVVYIFLVFTTWWLILFSFGIKGNFQNYFFAATYGTVALLGGLWGVQTSFKWGGFRSVMGKAIMYLSLGLLAAEFGQLAFSFYNVILHVEIPYPSVADLGFFGNIPLYSLGMFYLGKVSGVQFTIKKLTHKLQIIILPLILLLFSYFVFLNGYDLDSSQPLKTFLDFGYPLGQAVYLSVGLLVYSLSKNLLGGIMKKRIMLIIFAFICQYIADYNFLFQNSRGTWYNGGYGDLLYFIAYTTMAIGLIHLGNALASLKNS